MCCCHPHCPTCSVHMQKMLFCSLSIRSIPPAWSSLQTTHRAAVNLNENHNTTASNNGLCRFHSWWSSLAQVTNKFHRLPPLPEIQELSGISKDQDEPSSTAKASQQWELLSFPPLLWTTKYCHPYSQLSHLNGFCIFKCPAAVVILV